MGSLEPEYRHRDLDHLMRSFTSRIALDDHQYEVSLPWEGTSQHLINNMAVTGMHLTSLQTKFIRAIGHCYLQVPRTGLCRESDRKRNGRPRKENVLHATLAVFCPDSIMRNIRMVLGVLLRALGPLSLSDVQKLEEPLTTFPGHSRC